MASFKRNVRKLLRNDGDVKNLEDIFFSTFFRAPVAKDWAEIFPKQTLISPCVSISMLIYFPPRLSFVIARHALLLLEIRARPKKLLFH